MDNKEKGSFGWAVLVWKDQRHGDAKKAGIGALVGFICGFLLVPIISAIFYLAVWPNVQESIVQNTCETYGANYKAREVNGVWECYDPATNEVIKIDTIEE